MTPEQGNNEISKFIYTRTYSKWIPELERRETWSETVDRYLSWILRDIPLKKAEKKDIYDELFWDISTSQVMPSMRAMWSAGKAADRDNTATYNCSYLVLDSIQAFKELLYILMCGTGVGYSCELRHVDKLPRIEQPKNNPIPVHIEVADSKEGWAQALYDILWCEFSGYSYFVDYSKIRPAGSRLKTFGGRASGPEPLIELANFVKTLFAEKRRRKEYALTPLDVHDIACMTAEIVVVGGVRRSSLISLSDLEDKSMRDAKNWPFPDYRAMANNSGVFKGDEDYRTFKREWENLVASGSGERGIFNRAAAYHHAEHRDVTNFGINPCFAPETLIATKAGHYPIKDLVGKSVEIWNGEDWQTVNNFRVTATNQPILKVTFHDGNFVRVTPYHTFILDNGDRVEARHLQPNVNSAKIASRPSTFGNAVEKGSYLKGFLVGDGTHLNDSVENAGLSLYSTKYICIDRLLESANELSLGELRTNTVSEFSFVQDGGKRMRMRGLSSSDEQLGFWTTYYRTRLPVRVYSWDKQSITEFIAGVLDADGTASKTVNGFMYQISSVHEEWLLDFQQLLKTIGVNSKISLNREKGLKDFNDGYGEYTTQACYRLTISQEAAKILAQEVIFERLASFATEKIVYKLKPKWNKIVSVEPDGFEEILYCCTVEGSHSLALTNGIQIGQCAEILLKSNQFCNLSEVVVRSNDNYQSLHSKVQMATMLGVFQATKTDFPFLNSEWKKNCDEERLLGVSLTGQYDNLPLLTDERLDAIHSRSKYVAEYWSNKLGINTPTAITCVKPSGTVSQLVNASSGAHPRYANYYLRRYRISENDPLFHLMQDCGFSAEADDENGRTQVVTFPVKAPEHAVTRHNVSALDQLNHYLKMQTHWSEHNTSITIYVKKNEWQQLGEEVWNNFKNIVGVAFLPSEDEEHIYERAPYEEITEEQYAKAVETLPVVDYSRLSEFEKEDTTTGGRDFACVGGACELT